MDSLTAFARGQAARADGVKPKVFDWHQAARLIRAALTNDAATSASAGLEDDWLFTGGKIFASGQPVPRDDTYVYLASTWATPEIRVNRCTEPCWIWTHESDGWDAYTYWPDSALAILTGDVD